jgi:hypothetical protein
VKQATLIGNDHMFQISNGSFKPVCLLWGKKTHKILKVDVDPKKKLQKRV